MSTNIAIITNPITGTVEVQVPVTVSSVAATVAILYHKHSEWEIVSIDSDTGAVDHATARHRARTRLRGMLATSTDEHTIQILRRCAHALEESS